MRLWASSVVSTLVLTSLALAAVRGDGARPFVVVVVGLALLTGATVLGDLPRAVTFDADGIRRRCLVRDQRIGWDAVVAVERLRPTLLRRGGTRGLVARGRRGRWLLTDRTEPPAVHDELRRLVAAVVPTVRWDVPEPTWARE